MSGMTAPVTLPSPDRLNTGGAYAVTIRERRRLLAGAPWAEKNPVLQYMAPQDGPGYGRIHFTVKLHGTVTPDGSLSVEPEPWAARHYRRAVMRGAGVYRWGLWAMLAPGRAAAEPDAQAGAALGGNVDVPYEYSFEALECFSSPEVKKTRREKRKMRRDFKRMSRSRKAYKGECRASRRVVDKYVNRAAYLYGLVLLDGWHSASNGIRRQALYAVIGSLIDKAFKLSDNVRLVLSGVIKRGDAYRAYLARIVKPRRAPRRAPRPLHAQPRPPAAPLAPPALA